MFDTNKVAKTIREARIARNLTQMNLADAMGVSYQAVSNWERGNSMPDISKLEDLCNVLALSPGELLGMESGAATRILAKEDAALTAEELSELAPVLPPVQVKAQARKQKLNVALLVSIAPYLDEAFLEELLEDVEVDDLLVLQSLAPYLSEESLDALVRRATNIDPNGIAAMAPFLEEETLDWLVRNCGKLPEDTAFLETLAPFLSEETLDWAVRQLGGGFDRKMLETLAPFLEEETVRKIVKAMMAQGDLEAVKEAVTFL